MLYTIVAVLVLVVDQAVKFFTVRNIVPQAIGDACIPLIPGVIHMTNVQNTGAAFSIMADMRWLLVAVSVLFIVGIIVLISMDIIHTKFGRWTAVLVMAGALGNCIDRVLYGYVVDMFEFDLFNFAVFNVADIFITVCGILFCLHVILYREPAEEYNAVPRKAKAPKAKRARRPAPEPAYDDDDFFDDEEEDDLPPARPQRRSGRTGGRPAPARQARQPKDDAYANIPHRGAHRSLEDELRLADPDDPFAEWDTDAPASRPRPAAGASSRRQETPAAPARRRSAPAEESWDDDYDLELDRAPARRPAASAAQAKAPTQQPAPKKQSAPAASFDEYSLDDILSEFRDL